jgi:hypothetical protein
VRRRLTENARKPWRQKMWCIPRVDREFVARMEDGLDLYTETIDQAPSDHPAVVVSHLAPVGHKHINMRGVPTFDLSGHRSSLLRQTPSPDAGRAAN